MQKLFLQSYDFNLPLHDAIADPALSVARRMLAGAAIPQGLNDAHYSTVELFEAFELLVADRRQRISNGRGAERVQEILAADGDDFQRRIYYVVSELDVFEAMTDLAWLAELTRARAEMYRVLRAAGVPMPLIPGVAKLAGDAGQLLPPR